MIYVKAVDGVVVSYPYTQTDLVRDTPSTSFPSSGISPVDLAQWNVYPVHFAPVPDFDPRAKRLIENAPLFDGSSWIQQFSVVDLSQDEIDAQTAAAASAARDQRNKLLAESDWTQLPDSPPDALAWGVYRKALRDIPSQAGFPWDIIWPTQPG